MTTIHDAVTHATGQLEAAAAQTGSSSKAVYSKEDRTTARLEAEILLAHSLNQTRTYLRTWPERTLSPDQQNTFKQYTDRRITGEPIAYILGQRAFYDLELHVTSATLIPRPETELLVELALEKIPVEAQWQLADLGTGSGAIALVLAKQRPQCHIIATDRSNTALDVARENACQQNITNIELLTSRWFESLGTHRFQLIASNPPYIAEQDPHLQQGDLRFEPEEALGSGEDGLNDIRQIIEHAPKHLEASGWLMLEHGYDQAEAVTQLLRQRGFDQVTCHTDFSGNDRVSCGQWRG